MQKEPENPVLAPTGRKAWLWGAELPPPHSDAWWWLSEKQPESDIKITAKSIKPTKPKNRRSAQLQRVGGDSLRSGTVAPPEAPKRNTTESVLRRQNSARPGLKH